MLVGDEMNSFQAAAECSKALRHRPAAFRLRLLERSGGQQRDGQSCEAGLPESAQLDKHRCRALPLGARQQNTDRRVARLLDVPELISI
jgi:hypothetical protein